MLVNWGNMKYFIQKSVCFAFANYFSADLNFLFGNTQKIYVQNWLFCKNNECNRRCASGIEAHDLHILYA